MDRRLQRLLFLVAGAVILIWLYTIHVSHRVHPIKPENINVSGLEAANATLGFGAIVAVSRPGSPRRDGLLMAANITELDITIPHQPAWTESDLANLRAETGSTISRGSALAWLGHLNALRWFLATDLETVLILEDDVDWDIHLRTSQIPSTAAAIRQLVTDTDTTNPNPRTSDPKPSPNSYWGPSSPWDILYLGHCGDLFPPSSLPASHPHLTIPDPYLPSRVAMHPYTQSFLSALHLPEQTRLIHQSISPLCTFAFALTRPAAQRLLTDIAARESDGGTMAYDVRVLEACRDLGFRCWTANPELFHHQEAPSEIADVNAEGAGDDGVAVKAGADSKGRLKAVRTGSAPNIACGVRGAGFWPVGEVTLEVLREVVGRQGRCFRVGPGGVVGDGSPAGQGDGG